MICYICGEIGRVAVFTDKHVIFQLKLINLLLRLSLGEELFCQHLAVFIPQRTVKLIGQTLLFHELNCIFKLCSVVQGAFEEPCIIFYSVLREIVMHRLNIFRQSIVYERLSALLLACAYIFIPVYGGEFLCSVHNILAMVAVLRKLGGILALINLLIAYIKGEREFVNLVARIVDIEFAADIIAREIHNGGKAVTQSPAPGVAHMHRSCRICGDKLNIYFFAFSEIGAAVVFALIANIL